MSNASGGDGRNARRERNRVAVIEAVFSLVQEGKVPPSVEDVAARAGVSVSSIFRNFDGLADMQRQALDHSDERFAASFEVVDASEALATRIRSHVRTRIELYGAAGGLMRVARGRALDHEPMVEGVARTRARLADQTRQRFAGEVEKLSPAAAADLVAIVDTVTSPEAYELMTAGHARTSRQISRAWTSALAALLEQPTTDQPAVRMSASRKSASQKSASQKSEGKS